MMDFCGKHNILSDIEIVSTNKINEMFDRLEKNDVKFRFVFDITGKSKLEYQEKKKENKLSFFVSI